MFGEIVIGLLAGAVAGIMMLGWPGAARANGSSPQDEVMADLKAGNERYVQGRPAAPPNCGPERRRDTALNGQKPKAVVLSCSDSRVPVEYIFDQGLGDLFVIRVAGNVAAADETASIEYGADHLGAPLVVVLGHTGCGAVTAVVEGAELHGNLALLLTPVVEAAARVKARHPSPAAAQFLDETIKANIWYSVESLFKLSPLMRRLAALGRIKVVGARYDLESGRVEWLGEHPRQAALLENAAEAGR